MEMKYTDLIKKLNKPNYPDFRWTMFLKQGRNYYTINGNHKFIIFQEICEVISLNTAKRAFFKEQEPALITNSVCDKSLTNPPPRNSNYRSSYMDRSHHGQSVSLPW